MDNDLARAHRVMREQYGVAGRRQLVKDHGVPRVVIDQQLRSGRWESVDTGIYRVAGSGTPAQQHLMVAVLQCPPESRLTGASVLALLGIEGFDLEQPAVVIVARPRGFDADGDFRVHRVPLPPIEDRAEVCGIPAVTPTRALLDHARLVRGKALRVAVDAVRRAGLTTPQRLLDRALAAGRAHGASSIVKAVLSGTFRHESEGERTLAALFYDHDPPLEFNVWLLPDVRVDAVWQDAKLVLEYQGRSRHTLPTDVERDRVRLARLRAAGYAVVEVWSQDLRDPVALRRRVLALRSQRLATTASA